MTLDLTTLEQIALETGKPVYVVLDEIVEQELNKVA